MVVVEDAIAQISDSICDGDPAAPHLFLWRPHFHLVWICFLSTCAFRTRLCLARGAGLGTPGQRRLYSTVVHQEPTARASPQRPGFAADAAETSAGIVLYQDPRPILQRLRYPPGVEDFFAHWSRYQTPERPCKARMQVTLP